jgi:hypothetical protein
VAPPVRISAPPSPDAKTAIYVALIDGEPPFVYVADLASGEGAVPEFVRKKGTTAKLYAAYYGCPSSVLGLTPGKQNATTDSTVMAGVHPLPPSSDAYTAIFDDHGAAPLTKIDWSVELSTVRIPRQVRCAKFELARTTLSNTATIGIPLQGYREDDSSLIISLVDGRYFRVGTQTFERLALPPDLPFHSHYVDADGQVWLFGPSGKLAKGRFDSGFSAQPSSPRAIGVVRSWSVGPRNGEPFELFGLDDSGGVQRFDGTSWNEIHQIGTSTMPTLLAGIAWAGANEVVVVSPYGSPHDAVIYQNGSATASGVPLAGSGRNEDALTYTTWVPSLGVILGTAFGHLYQWTGAAWKDLYPSPTEHFGQRFVSAIAPLDDGFLVAAGLGELSQYQPELERDAKFCDYRSEPPVDAVLADRLANAAVSDIVPLSCGYALLSTDGGHITNPFEPNAINGDPEITFLTRTQ